MSHVRHRLKKALFNESLIYTAACSNTSFKCDIFCCFVSVKRKRLWLTIFLMNEKLVEKYDSSGSSFHKLCGVWKCRQTLSQLRINNIWNIIKTGKNSSLNGIWIHDLCDTCAVLYKLSCQANLELVTLCVRNIPVDGEECKRIYERSCIWTAEKDMKWSSQLWTQLRN